MMSLSIFLGAYPPEIRERFLATQSLVASLLPDAEQVLDLPAKMLAFTYGTGYKDIICVLIPSRNGLKLSFSQGAILSNNTQLLEGNGKKSRYVEIKNITMLQNPELQKLIRKALIIYNEQKR
ncbi:MAG: DUF1801 domain-containing protein [Fluviicola sp.]|nr:DUF1801 domain-containing protein [Fluviicola sp.]